MGISFQFLLVQQHYSKTNLSKVMKRNFPYPKKDFDRPLALPLLFDETLSHFFSLLNKFQENPLSDKSS